MRLSEIAVRAVGLGRVLDTHCCAPALRSPGMSNASVSAISAGLSEPSIFKRVPGFHDD